MITTPSATDERTANASAALISAATSALRANPSHDAATNVLELIAAAPEAAGTAAATLYSAITDGFAAVEDAGAHVLSGQPTWPRQCC